MYGVSQRVEARKHIERNGWIGMPAVVLRNGHQLRPCPGAVDAYALSVWAQMTPPCQAIATMSTGDVPLAHDQIAAREAFHMIADTINNADKLVADRHWHRNRFLRPLVPIVDVHVRSADRRFQHANEHIIARDCRNWNFLEPKTGLGLGL